MVYECHSVCVYNVVLLWVSSTISAAALNTSLFDNDRLTTVHAPGQARVSFDSHLCVSTGS